MKDSDSFDRKSFRKEKLDAKKKDRRYDDFYEEARIAKLNKKQMKRRKQEMNEDEKWEDWEDEIY